MSYQYICATCGKKEQSCECHKNYPRPSRAQDEIERLRAELAAAKRDAERYRWLRDKAGNSIMRRLMDSAIPPEWDDMIDEAMKGEE